MSTLSHLFKTNQHEPKHEPSLKIFSVLVPIMNLEPVLKAKGFCDLNVPVELDFASGKLKYESRVADLVLRAAQLGYQTVALNVQIHQDDLTTKKVKLRRGLNLIGTPFFLTFLSPSHSRPNPRNTTNNSKTRRKRRKVPVMRRSRFSS